MTTTRNTVQRREVIGVLSRLQGFVSAQELHTLIERDGGRIALATVYTQLKRLVVNGEVDVVMTDRGESALSTMRRRVTPSSPFVSRVRRDR